MALDQHRPAPGPSERINPLDQRPVLVVDPDALNTAARYLDGLPGPQDPNPAPPPPAAIGHPGLARAVAAFDQRYRAVGLALASDDDTASAHLARAAATYTRADSEASSRLTELNVAPPPTDIPRTGTDSTDSNIGGQTSDDRHSDLRQV
jgi:hypothetical protein